MDRFSTARSAVTVLAIVALVVISSGAAFAATRGGGLITACVHQLGGGLYHAKHCARHDGKPTWSVAGPPGATGPHGPAGAKGDSGAQGAQGDPVPARGFACLSECPRQESNLEPSD